jgi:uncharacterized RDD family membrane protein YckC
MTQTLLPDPIYQAEFYSDVAKKRLIAWIVDTLVILLICVVILPFTAFVALFMFPALFLVVGFAYRTLSLTSRSATWGMRMMAMELRNHRGERFGFAEALIHTLGYSLSMAFVLPQVISVVLMAASPRGQGLTDMVLGTAAINRS